jgi:hypothetical protein
MIDNKIRNNLYKKSHKNIVYGERKYVLCVCRMERGPEEADV